jgi:hypothetical protein
MGTLLIISAISAGSIAFLTYFGFALWRDERQQKGKRVLILQLREVIARKRPQQRLLYMHKLETIRPLQGAQARKR